MPRRAPPPPKLAFRKSLTKDSKLTTTELLKRLDSLFDELSKLDQDTVDRDSLSSVRDELIQPSLLVHKDKGVKALVACCIANLLRLYAPDAPYTLPELRDIFQFFFRQIRNLSSSKNCQSSHGSLYLKLLESLCAVESIVLVCDVPQSEELMLEIFQVLFTVVSTEISQNFLLAFADLLTQIIIATSPVVPPAVLSLLLTQFRPKQLTSNPAAYRLAVDICNACEDCLKQDVCRYFNELMAKSTSYASSQPSDSELSDNEGSPGELATTFKELEATHKLIQNVYRSCPGLLQSVIPQLEMELQNSQTQPRLLAAQTLGELFTDQPTGSTSGINASKTLALNQISSTSHWSRYNHHAIGNDLASKYPSTWKMWLRKASDVSSQIRVAIVRLCGPILTRQHHLKGDINCILMAKLHDTDEKVRAECCQVFGELELDHALLHVELKVLIALGGRIEDRKPTVQQEALRSLGKLFKSAYPRIETRDVDVVNQFSWIPQAFLSSMFAGDPRLCASVERSFLDYVAPIPTSSTTEQAWVDRLLNIARCLDDINLKRLTKFARLGIKRPTGFDRFLEACKNYNGGVMDSNEKETKARLAAIIRHISTHFPDPPKAMDDLQKFAKLNDKQTLKLLSTLSDQQLDMMRLIKAWNEFQRRVKSLSISVAETMQVFLHKSAYLILNSASVPTLLQRLRLDQASESNIESDFSDRATRYCAKFLLDKISLGCPMMLKPHLDQIIKILPPFALSDIDAELIECCLLALSLLARTDTEVIRANDFLLDQLMQFAQQGTQLQVKLATTILAVTPAWSTACKDLNDIFVGSLGKVDSARLLCNLAGLSRIAKHSSAIFEALGAKVTSFVVHDLLLKSSEGDQVGDEDWITDENLSDSNKARIEGLAVLTHRCVTYSKTLEAKKFSTPIFKLYWQLMEGDGRVGSVKHSVAVAARLRLKAALSVIKLASYPAFQDQIHARFTTLAWMVQDPYYPVRESFIIKLVKYLQQRRLIDVRFNVILFLVAHDPEPGIIQMARNSVQSRLKIIPPEMRTATFETPIVRLLHLIAHHADFGTQISDLQASSKYIEFFIDCVANSENVSLLYHLAGQLKTVSDIDPDFDSESLYIVSELAQLIISKRARDHHWALPSYPGITKLPTDIFKPLPTPTELAQVSRKTFLSDEILNALIPSKHQTSKKERQPVPLATLKETRSTTTKRTPQLKTGKASTQNKRQKRASPGSDTIRSTRRERPARKATGKLKEKIYHETDTVEEYDSETSSHCEVDLLSKEIMSDG